MLMEIFISWVTILEGFNPYAEWIFMSPASRRAHFNFLSKFDHFYFDVGLRSLHKKLDPDQTCVCAVCISPIKRGCFRKQGGFHSLYPLIRHYEVSSAVSVLVRF